jgi:hypothetical protein
MLFRGVRLYKAVLTLLPFVAPIKIASSKLSMQDVDLMKWNVYRVEWRGNEARFYINGYEVAKLRSGRSYRARADIWIDNAVFMPFRGDAGKVYRHVTQENRVRTRLEVDYVEIEDIKKV